jgi:hypothetical protein
VRPTIETIVDGHDLTAVTGEMGGDISQSFLNNQNLPLLLALLVNVQLQGWLVQLKPCRAGSNYFCIRPTSGIPHIKREKQINANQLVHHSDFVLGGIVQKADQDAWSDWFNRLLLLPPLAEFNANTTPSVPHSAIARPGTFDKPPW